MSEAGVVVLLLFLLPFVLGIWIWRSKRACAKKIATMKLKIDDAEIAHQLALREKEAEISALIPYRDKYRHIPEAEKYCADLTEKARRAAQSVVDLIKQKEILYQQKARELEFALAEQRRGAESEAERIVSDAHAEAREIAGSALDAKDKVSHYEAKIKAMRNQIEGYGDEYLIANRTVLDGLAEEYSHKEAGEDLKRARKRSRDMVKAGLAATCDYVEHQRRTTAVAFVLDAFNGKVDVVLSKVKHDNYGKLKQELIDAFSLVNGNGLPFRSARIQPEYLIARQVELELAVKVHELRLEEREEQRKIKEAMREEEKARREIDRAIKQAEKEERMLQDAMKIARQSLEGAAFDERSKFETQLAELQQKLEEAESRGERALSMAQQTRRGHVYVISNLGSFGEHVYKIGLTRRLEPMDRVKELGDASVPFEFDVHAMIYSEDSPELERRLHEVFNEHRLNKVNPRKEFFRINLEAIRNLVAEHMGAEAEIHWTMLSEAREFKESQAMGQTIEGQVNLAAIAPDPVALADRLKPV